MLVYVRENDIRKYYQCTACHEYTNYPRDYEIEPTENHPHCPAQNIDDVGRKIVVVIGTLSKVAEELGSSGPAGLISSIVLLKTITLGDLAD